ncbi:unnamed protein product, partial [Brenthis ino]
MAEAPEPTATTGRLIISYLQNTRSGATVSDIIQHLQTKSGKESNDLKDTRCVGGDEGVDVGDEDVGPDDDSANEGDEDDEFAAVASSPYHNQNPVRQQ